MKPDDPVTSTLPSGIPFQSLRAQLIDSQQRSECESIPAHVSGDPPNDLEIRCTVGAFEPDRRNLGDWPSQPPGLCDELDPDLEPGVRLDPDLAYELRRIRLERVRGVAGTNACKPEE